MPIHRTRTRGGEARVLGRDEAKHRAKRIYGPLRTKDSLSDLDVGLAKCLLQLGVSITIVADLLATHHAYVSAIRRGELYPHIPALELWSRDVTGGLHKRLTVDDFLTTWSDVYAVYNNSGDKRRRRVKLSPQQRQEKS